MAQPMTCDFPQNHEDPAQPVLAVEVRTTIATGEVTALCELCQVLLAAQQLEALGATVLPPAPPDQATAPAGADDQDEDDEDAQDGEEAAVTRLEQVGTRTVKRGTSPSRRAHEARKRNSPAGYQRAVLEIAAETDPVAAEELASELAATATE